MTTSPTQGEHAQTEAMYAAAMEFAAEKASISYVQRKCRCSYNDAERMLERMVSEGIIETYSGRKAGAQVAALTATPAQPAAPQGVAYAELPMQFACSGVSPVYSADQMRAFADGTHSLRTKSEASREFLERMLSAMEGVIDVADRKTDEFEALRSCVVDLTLILFKPEALRASNGQAPAGATPWRSAVLDLIDECPGLTMEQDHWLSRRVKELEFASAPRHTAQAAPAAPDFTTLGAAMRAIRQALELIGEPADDRMRAVRRVLRGAVIVAEDSGELAAPAAGAVAGMPPGIGALMCVISSLRDTAHFSDEEGELTDELRTLRDWAMTQAAAPTPAAQADGVLEDAARLEQIAEAIRDYHHALDMRKHGGLAESVAFNSICQTMGMTWNQGEEAARRAARKQGGKHD